MFGMKTSDERVESTNEEIRQWQGGVAAIRGLVDFADKKRQKRLQRVLLEEAVKQRVSCGWDRLVDRHYN